LGHRDILKIINNRVPGVSILITPQLPTEAWHDYIGEPTIADAMLDRTMHNQHSIKLISDSMRHRK